MSELEYFLSVENIEISLNAQARQSLLLLTHGESLFTLFASLTYAYHYLMTLMK